MEYRRLNTALPALGKVNPRWLWFGEHRGLRKRVLESFRLKDTIRAIDSDCYCPDGEPKDSVDQDTRYRRPPPGFGRLPCRLQLAFRSALPSSALLVI